jgi:hypothetical protein
MASDMNEPVGCTLSTTRLEASDTASGLWRDGTLEWFSAGRGADPANHELPSVIRVGLVGSPP